MSHWSSDIFTEIEDALAFIAFANPEVAAMVKPGNRLTFNGSKPDPEKDTLSQSDVPEMALWPTGFSNDAQRTSNGEFIAQSYEWRVRTDQMRARGDTTQDISRGLNQLKYAIVKAHKAWGDRLPGVHFEGQTPGVRLSQSVEEQIETADRGISGWAAILTVTVTVVQRRSELVFANCKRVLS